MTTNLIMAEVHRLLLFRAGIAPASRALDRIESSSSVSIEFPVEAHHRVARGWLDRLAGHAISYTDAVSFAIMEAVNCRTALAFDRDFILAGFALWSPGVS